MSIKDDRKALHYRWEFLRRNPDFRADFDAFVKRFSTWFEQHGWWYDPDARLKYDRSESEYLRLHVQPRAHHLMMNWDIEKLIPYAWSFDQNGRFEVRKGVCVDLPGRFWTKSHGELRVMDEDEMKIEAKRRTSEYHFDEGISGADVPDSFWDRYLYLVIDTSFPVQSILVEIESEILRTRREYKKKHGSMPRGETRHRRRFDQYEDYLKV